MTFLKFHLLRILLILLSSVWSLSAQEERPNILFAYTVQPITSQYTDLIFYQMYARYEVQKPGLDRWSKQVDKPFINCYSAFTMTTKTMPRSPTT